MKLPKLPVARALPILLVLLMGWGLMAPSVLADEGKEIESEEAFVVESALGAPPTLLDRLGRFHVALVHFPIAWVALAAMAVLARRRWAALGNADLLLAGLGLAAGAAALATGLLHEESVEHNLNIEPLLESHEQAAWVAVILLTVAFVAALLGWRKQHRGLRSASAVLLVGAALMMFWTGHLGGAMVYGRDFLFGP